MLKIHIFKYVTSVFRYIVDIDSIHIISSPVNTAWY